MGWFFFFLHGVIKQEGSKAEHYYLASIFFPLSRKGKARNRTILKSKLRRKRTNKQKKGKKNKNKTPDDSDLGPSFPYKERLFYPLIVLLHFPKASRKLLPHPAAPRTQAAIIRLTAFLPSSYCGCPKKPPTPTHGPWRRAANTLALKRKQPGINNETPR